jgi:hypothetical protein
VCLGFWSRKKQSRPFFPKKGKGHGMENISLEEEKENRNNNKK